MSRTRCVHTVLQQGQIDLDDLSGTFCLLFKEGTHFVKFQGLVLVSDGPAIGVSLVFMEVTGWVVLECQFFLYFSSLVPLLIVELMIKLRSSGLWVISSELWFFFLALLVLQTYQDQTFD